MRKIKTYPLLCAIFASTGAFSADFVHLGPFEVGFDLCLARPGETTRHVRPAEMARLDVTTQGGRTTATWRGHPLCGAAFAVTAEFVAQAEGGWTWAFRYDGNAVTNLDVESIEFPLLLAPRTDKTAVVIPRSLGQLRRPDWAKAKADTSICEAVPYAFRFIAALDEAAGNVYLDERGARGYMGAFVVRQGAKPNTACLVARHEIPVTDGSNRAFALPYGGTFRTFRGGWYEAARIYRAWVRTQEWAKAARRRPVSPKFRDIALWMWNRGGAEHVLAPAERFQDETGLKAALDWYWWHKIPYDHEYPHFWPPREGEDAFCAAIARAHRRGIFMQVYTNGMTWDCDSATFVPDGGLESVALNVRGKPYERHPYNVFTGHALAYMCGTRNRHQDYFAGVARRLASCGLDGLYMDQIGCCSLKNCWNAAHRHAPGGGTTQTDGYRAFFRRIKAENPDLLLSSEEPSEEYLDCNEAAICLWQTPERFGTPGAPACEAVPVFTALHHGETTLFGTYAVMGGRPPWDPTWPDANKWKDEAKWERLYPKDQFALEVSAGPVMGIQPCVHNLTLEQIGDPRLAADWAFLKETARFYHAHRAWLFEGEMLSPGTMACETKTLDMAIRGIYTTEKTLRITRSAQPSVRHSVWRAPSGETAAILVNWTSEPRTYELRCDLGTFKGELPPRTWKCSAAGN